MPSEGACRRLGDRDLINLAAYGWPTVDLAVEILDGDTREQLFEGVAGSPGGDGHESMALERDLQLGLGAKLVFPGSGSGLLSRRLLHDCWTLDLIVDRSPIQEVWPLAALR